ncbi:hypothetical protein [Nannocystis exedens]|uniref:hypothetical protein n=1 Tax=Nannocystis exedens TaxID=54 RepID=UPI0014727C57|nr:hypothetical protein [Nannocystis exedens]
MLAQVGPIPAVRLDGEATDGISTDERRRWRWIFRHGQHEFSVGGSATEGKLVGRTAVCPPPSTTAEESDPKGQPHRSADCSITRSGAAACFEQRRGRHG